MHHVPPISFANHYERRANSGDFFPTYLIEHLLVGVSLATIKPHLIAHGGTLTPSFVKSHHPLSNLQAISKMSRARVTRVARVARSSRSSHSRPGLSLFSKSIHPSI